MTENTVHCPALAGCRGPFVCADAVTHYLVAYSCRDDRSPVAGLTYIFSLHAEQDRISSYGT